MADITNIQMTASKVTGSGNNWDITVSYDAVFSNYEWKTANFNFRDGFVLMESDAGEIFGGSDDQLTGVVAVSSFNPNEPKVRRVMKLRISGDTLDTELGAEELYPVVRLRNLDLNLLYPPKKGPILQLNP